MFRMIKSSSSKDNSYPEITAVVEETENLNDSVSTKAEKIRFYNTDEEDIGTASVSAIDTNDAFLYNFEVWEEYRGQGYGNAILQYCLNHYDITTLLVEPDNHTAINLYRKFEFEKVGECYDEDILHDVMKRNLTF